MATKQYYLYWQGRRSGPFSAAQVRQLSRDNRLRAEDLIWTPGLKCPIPVCDVAELAVRTSGVLLPPPPPPLVAEATAVELAESSPPLAAPPPIRILPPPPPPSPRQLAECSGNTPPPDRTAMIRQAVSWLWSEARATGRAVLQQVTCAAKYLTWNSGVPGPRPPLLAPERITRIRAAVGGTMAVALVGLTLVVRGAGPTPSETTPDEIAASQDHTPAKGRSSARRTVTRPQSQRSWNGEANDGLLQAQQHDWEDQQKRRRESDEQQNRLRDQQQEQRRQWSEQQAQQDRWRQQQQRQDEERRRQAEEERRRMEAMWHHQQRQQQQWNRKF